MKKIISLLIALLPLHYFMFSQTNISDENNISVDYQYVKCMSEPDAPAVVLFDKGETRFIDRDASFHYVFERKVRIKILTEPGLKWAQIEIPIYNSRNVVEKVKEFNAFSYYIENNKVVRTELNNADCHIEKQSDKLEVMKFAIPKACVGSVIEYSYTIESNYLFNIPDWNFQWEIPVVYSCYKIHMVPFYQYQYYLQGANKFDEYKSEAATGLGRSLYGVSFMDMDHTFVMKNLSSFKNEGFITSISDYIIKIDFQLSKIIYPGGSTEDVITTWPLLIKDLLDDSGFGKFELKARAQAKKIINLEELSKLSDSQRFDSIVNFVKKNFIWDEDYRLKSSQSINQFLKDKHGSSAEINLFTIGLLNAAGISSYPVILSTRNHGKVNTLYPFYDEFNSVLILSEFSEKSVLTDATSILLENDRIPVNCINGTGLVIKPVKDKESWYNLQSRNLSHTKTTIFSSLENNQINSEIIISSNEYDGLQLRKNYGTDKEKILKHLIDENNEVSDTSLVVNNMEDSKSPYSLRYKVGNRIQNAGDNIYIEPFLHEIPSENPFKLVQRTYPVDLVYPYKHSYVASINIPVGYSPSFLPTDKRYSGDNLEFNYHLQKFDDKIVVSFFYALKKSVYQPEEYQQLKSFFKNLIDAAGEKIVLKKI